MSFPEQILEYIASISKLGERAAGVAEEITADRFVEEQFRDIGLDHVHLEPVPVVSRKYVKCQLRIAEPVLSDNDVACVTAGTCGSTSTEGLSNELVDAGCGTLRDFERLEKARVRLGGKIALIERCDRLTCWPYIACRLACDFHSQVQATHNS